MEVRIVPLQDKIKAIKYVSAYVSAYDLAGAARIVGELLPLSLTSWEADILNEDLQTVGYKLQHLDWKDL